MSSYILSLAFTQLRLPTNRAVCSDHPDLDNGDVTRIPPGHFLFRSRRWWRYMGFPRADRGLIPVQIEAIMTFHGQMTSSQQLYFRFHIYSCVHPPNPRAVVRAADCTRDFRCVPHIAYLKAATSSLVRMSHCGPNCRSKRGKHSFFLNLRLVPLISPPPQSLGHNPLPPIFNILVSRDGSRTAGTYHLCTPT